MSYEYLDGIGRERSETLFKAIPALLADAGKKIADGLVKNLRKHTASGSLEESIDPKIHDLGNDTWKLTLSLNSYWKYLDKGVKGSKSTYPSAAQSPYRYTTKPPPYSAINNFLKQKSIEGVVKGGKKNSTHSSKAYFIRKKIFEKGLKGTGFYSKVVNAEMLAVLDTELTKLMRKKIIVEII